MMIFPFNLQTTLIASGVALVTGLYGGYKLTSNYYDAKQSKVDQAVIEQLVNQASIDRTTISYLNIDKQTLQKAYSSLGRKANETKLTSNKCTVTDDAIRLRNESLLGKEVLPGAPTGTNATGGTRASGGIDFTTYFQNDLDNDEKCNINRAKIKRMYDWCISTFGEDRCKGIEVK
jgi:hypothetical protein